MTTSSTSQSNITTVVDDLPSRIHKLELMIDEDKKKKIQLCDKILDLEVKRQKLDKKISVNYIELERLKDFQDRSRRPGKIRKVYKIIRQHRLPSQSHNNYQLAISDIEAEANEIANHYNNESWKCIVQEYILQPNEYFKHGTWSKIAGDARNDEIVTTN